MTDAEQNSPDADGTRLVARRAVVITPKQAFFDWLISISEDGRNSERMMREPERWPEVVLVPLFSDRDDAQLFFAEHFRDVLNWVLDPSEERHLRHKKPDFNTFLEWFEVTHADTITDYGRARFYVVDQDDFIDDDYGKWMKEMLSRTPPPPPVLKVTIRGERRSPETQARLDSVVCLARSFAWCAGLRDAYLKTKMPALRFEADADTELVDDLNERHQGITLHWLASLAAVIDGWEALGLSDNRLADCLTTGGDAASPGSYRYRLERVRSAVATFQNDPVLVSEIREYCQGDTIRWAANIEVAFHVYFRGFLDSDASAMKWVFR